MITKICSKCEQEKEICEFYINNRNPNLYRTNCKKCMNDNSQQYKKYNNPKTMDLLGCDYEFLISYIENKFNDGMSWTNYGYYGWHIDHIKPLSSAKTEDEVCKLYHYTNLQPLWCKENLRKSNKIMI